MENVCLVVANMQYFNGKIASARRIISWWMENVQNVKKGQCITIRKVNACLSVVKMLNLIQKIKDVIVKRASTP